MSIRGLRPRWNGTQRRAMRFCARREVACYAPTAPRFCTENCPNLSVMADLLLGATDGWLGRDVNTL